MATLYARTFVGVKDATLVPPLRADGRLVGAKVSAIVAPKVIGQAVANGDLMFIGTVRAGESVREILLNTDTSFGATTFSIGTIASPAKYRAAAVHTTPLNVPTPVGPIATIADDDPLTADEDLYATFAVGGVAAGVFFTFETRIASVK